MEKLYSELAHWWPQLSPPEDYDEEAAVYLALLMQAAGRDLDTVLELGSAGGHLASNMPEALELVLVDLSPHMLEASRALNPGRQHIQGDMRALRLERRFDAVILHDAVTYMTNEADLKAALETVKAHMGPDGVGLVAPDFTLETLVPDSNSVGGGEHARLLEWRHEPVGTTLRIDFALMLRTEDGVRVVHDTHTQGIFPIATWLRLFDEVGLQVLPTDLDVQNIVFIVRHA